MSIVPDLSLTKLDGHELDLSERSLKFSRDAFERRRTYVGPSLSSATPDHITPRLRRGFSMNHVQNGQVGSSSPLVAGPAMLPSSERPRTRGMVGCTPGVILSSGVDQTTTALLFIPKRVVARAASVIKISRAVLKVY